MVPYMKRIFNFAAAIIFLGFFLYLLLPGPRFPEQPHDSVQSLEDADTETPLRRAYFTNYTRGEVLQHYKRQFSYSLFGLALLNYRLNYPPEDSMRLIRDQARATYLEELVRPFRESIFINGFIPTHPKDAIGYRGTRFYQKVTIRYVSSSVFFRVPISALGLLAFYFVSKQFLVAFRETIKSWF